MTVKLWTKAVPFYSGLHSVLGFFGLRAYCSYNWEFQPNSPSRLLSNGKFTKFDLKPNSVHFVLEVQTDKKRKKVSCFERWASIFWRALLFELLVYRAMQIEWTPLFARSSSFLLPSIPTAQNLRYDCRCAAASCFMSMYSCSCCVIYYNLLGSFCSCGNIEVIAWQKWAASRRDQIGIAVL